MRCAAIMNGSRRIFVAAWEYPPMMSGESVVCRKTLEHSQFHYDVCCGPVEAAGDDHIRLYPTGGNKYLLWPLAVLRRFRELDRREHYRVMMSRVMPPNGHAAGWLIKKIRPEIKWAAYFSDPVWNSPFLRCSLGRDRSHRPSWLLMKVFGIPAKRALREADLLIFNNERLAGYVLGRQYERYRDKVVIAPYGHEGVKPRPALKREDGRVRLTHVGQIYGDRTLRALVGGAELLQKREPGLFRRLEIRQVGFTCETERQRVLGSAAAAAFTLIGQVPYGESIEEMYRADTLLVIDPKFDDPRRNIYVPGKIYDYMSTGRPVVCIAEEDSATGDVAKRAGYMVAEGTAEAVCGMLVKIITQGLKPDRGADSPIEEAFHCRIGVERSDQAIKRMLGGDRDGECQL